MKRILPVLLLLAVIVCFAFAAYASASAETSFYLKVERDGISLYENTAIQAAMFTLPKTYYVKILRLSYAPSYHLVEYNGVKGLIKISDFSDTPEENVPNPYYTSTLITAHIETVLYSSPSFSSRTEIAASGLSLTYLGKVNGEKGTYDTPVWFAVLYANEVYYLHCSLTNNLSLLESSFAPVHPNSVVEPDPSTPASGNAGAAAPTKDSFDVVRLLLIIGMIVPLLVIVFLLFKPRRRRSAPQRSRRYDREDDYDDYYDD